jgi:hypothetical protein
LHPLHVYVEEILASADPYYRGPHHGTAPAIHERVHPLDRDKTAEDLGRYEEDAFPTAALEEGPGPEGRPARQRR